MPDEPIYDSYAFQVLQHVCQTLRDKGHDNLAIASALATLLGASLVETREEYDSGEGFRKASAVLDHIAKGHAERNA